jgi:NAD(P)-dependent dehydrogenase (short-subunit alcohol dehydrogenase family)
MPVPGVALVVGVGPGLGAALARCFAAAGSRVALGARSEGFIRALAEELQGQGHPALAVPYDATRPEEVERALERVERELGPIDGLLYNVGGGLWGGIEDLTPDAFRAALEQGPFGAFLHVRPLFPRMAARGGGVALFTGATSSVRAPARGPAFAAAKFGLRGLALALARAWGPRGIHVAHVVVDGVIGQASDAMRPEDIAQVYLDVARQAPSAWTFEVDVRPFTDDVLEN